MKILRFQISHKFLSDASWSLAGNVLSVLTGLAVVKIITSLVVTRDYGQASLVMGVVALLNGLLVGPLMTAHLRVYFDYLERGMGRWFAKMFNRVLSVAGMVILLLYAFIALIFNLTGNTTYWELLIPVSILILAQPYLSTLTNYLESHRRQKELAIVNVLHKVVYPLFLILLLETTILPVNVIIISQGLAILFVLAVFRVPKAQKESNKWPEDKLKELGTLRNSIVEFGWALPLGYFVMWFVTTGDRYLIEHFSTLENVGIYAINYGFWSMPYIMLNGWLEILTRPLLYDKAAKNNWEGVKKIILQRTVFGLFVSVIGTFALYMLGESIAAIMFGKHYWVSRELMMIIAVAHCFYVVGYSIVPLFLAGKKSKTILLATSVAAVINFVINLIFIPTYGIVGAALTTLLTYVVWVSVLAGGAYLYMRDLTQGGTLRGWARVR